MHEASAVGSACIFFGTWRRIVPLLIVGVALVLQQTADLEKTATRWNFRYRFAMREEVVRLIERGELVATRDAIAMSRAADLPGRYRALSAGGYLLIARHAEGFSVTFYVKRVGMFDDDDYTAFVYRSGPGQPTTEVEDTDRFYDVEALQPHWFFVKHT